MKQGLDTSVVVARGEEALWIVFNLGHQRAIVFGLRLIEPELADADLVVTMDADGEDRPEDLLDLLDPLLEAPDDRKRLCVARRTKRTESVRFRAMYLCFRIVFRTLTGVTVRNGNYAAYRGWLARRMLLHPYFDRRHPAGVFFLAATVAFAAVPIILFGDPRYRVPAEPLFAVLAAAAVVSLVPRFREAG